MRKVMSFVLISSMLALSGCSDPKQQDILLPPETQEESTTPQIIPVETVKLERMADGYIYFVDLNGPMHLYTEEEMDRDYPMNIPGIDNVILYEQKLYDFSIQFVADNVHKRENARSENSIFLENPRFRVLDTDGNVTGEGAFYRNIRHAGAGGHFAFELDEREVSGGNNITVYGMKQNDEVHPLIVTFINVLGEENFLHTVAGGRACTVLQ